MDNTTILKILQNQATDEEKKDFFLRCEVEKKFKDEYIRLKNLWALSIDEKHCNKKQQFEQFWLKANKTKQTIAKRVLFEISKYAAIVILTLGLGNLLNSTITHSQGDDLIQTFSSEIGSVSSIELNDGSKIWLNTGSELKFTEKTEKKIVASLTGEAYFEIEHNPNRKFIVEVEKLQIQDLGTKFNIRANKQDNKIITTLIEGVIDIQTIKGKSLFKMKPNDHFIFNKITNKHLIEKIDANLAAGWKDGKFVFIDKSLRDICDEFERWYNVKIIIANKSIEQKIYTSVLKRSTTISQMLEMLKLTDGIEYEILTINNGPDKVKIK
jgi:ferric-dicitrate binding protein FerR (iron transport regulator)